MLRFLTAGESHGKGLSIILEGMVRGLPLTAEIINLQLSRRQKGYGRGGRMKIEKDRVEILAGVRGGKTTGAPISLFIQNLDWNNWKTIMDPETGSSPLRTVPRPGHADFSGTIKYRTEDIRDIIERASARETAARVAAGSVCKELLKHLSIHIYSRVVSIGTIQDPTEYSEAIARYEEIESSPFRALLNTEQMQSAIDTAREKGDTIGGIVELIATGLPIGLGSHVHWDRKLDGIVAQALMSIPAIKGVEIGIGFAAASALGSQVHDPFLYERSILTRSSNNAGGIEGGISNGMPLIARCAMKPIPSLIQGISSIDIAAKKSMKAEYERSDICAVVPASVVAEHALALSLAAVCLEKFGGDTLEELISSFQNHAEYTRRRTEQ